MILRLPPTLLFHSLNPQIPQSSLWEKNVRLQILVTEVATWGPRVLLPLQEPQEWENACWPGQQTWKTPAHLLASTRVAPWGAGNLKGRREVNPKLGMSLHSPHNPPAPHLPPPPSPAQPWDST